MWYHVPVCSSAKIERASAQFSNSASPLESHQRNLEDTTDLTRDYVFFDEIHDVMNEEEFASQDPIEDIIGRRKEVERPRPVPKMKVTAVTTKPSCGIL
jgi:hypothetical protein